jgi:hypothetical protein
VAVPEPVRLVGVIVPHARPVEGLSLSVTVPANPFKATIVMVELVEDPALTGDGEDADMVKFWNLNVAMAV